MRLLLLSFYLSTLAHGQTPGKNTVIDFDSLMIVKASEIIGKPFPDFVAANEEGKVNNDNLKGKVVLINFWFEGCHPCLAEFGALNELAQKLKGYKDFEFISFTWDNKETIKRVKKKYKLQFKVFQAAAQECMRLNQNSGYPTTIILDRQGIIKYWKMGGMIETEKAREYVTEILLPKITEEL